MYGVNILIGKKWTQGGLKNMKEERPSQGRDGRGKVNRVYQI